MKEFWLQIMRLIIQIFEWTKCKLNNFKKYFKYLDRQNALFIILRNKLKFFEYFTKNVLWLLQRVWIVISSPSCNTMGNFSDHANCHFQFVIDLHLTGCKTMKVTKISVVPISSLFYLLAFWFHCLLVCLDDTS